MVDLVLLLNFFIFAAIACSMLFGFYWMANRARNVTLEIASFMMSLLVGLLVAMFANLLIGESFSDHIATMTFIAAWSTLVAATPRLFIQSIRAEKFSIGFLLRLSAYIAVMIAIQRSDMGGALRQLGLPLTTLAVLFYAGLWAIRFTKHALVYLLGSSFMVYVGCVVFFFTVEVPPGGFQDTGSLVNALIAKGYLTNWGSSELQTASGILWFFCVSSGTFWWVGKSLRMRDSVGDHANELETDYVGARIESEDRLRSRR